LLANRAAWLLHQQTAVVANAVRRRYADRSGAVPTIEDRIAYLEGRVEEQSHRIDGVREAVVSLDRRIENLERRMDARFEAVDCRFEGIDRRFEGLERRLDGFDEKMTRYFVWLIGVQVSTLAAVVAAFASRA
jgi:uncharacterized coiled-coil protein SlyX